MLLIISRSDDGSMDLLEPLFTVPYIRINVDESDSWSFSYIDGTWTVASLGQVHEIGVDTRCWWWKAYLEPDEHDPHRNAEVEYICREIYAHVKRRGTIVGNSPLFHSELGKLAVLDAARDLLEVPETNCTFNSSLVENKNAIAKSLASMPFSGNLALYTTRVDTRALQSKQNPWLVQPYLDATHDVTSFLAGDNLYTFQRERNPDSTVDWRKEQLEDIGKKAWAFISLDKTTEGKVRTLAERLGVSWGRFDLLKDTGGKLTFLEFNANGQFGFLDIDNTSGMLQGIVHYLQGRV